MKQYLLDRQLLTVFGTLVAISLGLSVLSMFTVTAFPEPVLAVLRPVFGLLVYLPIAVVGAVVYEPLSVVELLGGGPLVNLLAQLVALLAVYYVITFVVVIAIRTIRSDVTGGA